MTRKIHEDGSKESSESMLLGVSNVDSRAWTGFTVFSRVTDPLASMVAVDESCDPGPA